MKVKQTNKKKEKAERYWQRKINLAQATAISDTPLFLVISAYYSLLFSIASTGGILLSLITDDSPLSIVLGHFLSLITSGGLLSNFFGCFSSLVTSRGPLSIFSSRFLSLIIGNSPLSAIFHDFLSLIASGSPLFAIFGGGSLFPMLSTCY